MRCTNTRYVDRSPFYVSKSPGKCAVTSLSHCNVIARVCILAFVERKEDTLGALFARCIYTLRASVMDTHFLALTAICCAQVLATLLRGGPQGSLVSLI